MNLGRETSLRVSRYEAASCMAPHHHEQPSLSLVLNGVYREKVLSREHDHGAGDLLFYPAYAVHSQQFGPKGTRKIIFTPKVSWMDYLSAAGFDLNKAPYARSPIFRQLGSRLLAELSNDDEFADIAQEGILLEVVAAFARQMAGEKAADPPQWLKTAREFIHETITSAPDIEQIAAVAGRHPVHMAREFRRFYSQSIGQYQRGLRVEKAARLLRETGCDVTEIALSCGFASHSHLCRVFKAAHGVTPTQFRAANTTSMGKSRDSRFDWQQ
jgi:AraC family transcriptional regulator